jgi:hydroxymethylbilane synthase
LPTGARIGTSSLRRACQIRHLRPDVQVLDLRGNVDTRLRKAQTEDYDAIVLAAAGLQRLDLAQVITELFAPETMIPAVAQGALAIECRADDHAVRTLLAVLNDDATEIAVRSERALLRRLEGGCQVPIAAHATLHDGQVRVTGLIGLPDGSQVVRDARTAAIAEAEAVGIELAEALLAGGGAAILARLSSAVPAIVAPPLTR